MTIDLNEKEQEFLVTLLENRTNELLHELHRAVRHEYKDALRKELETAEELMVKIGALVAA